MFVQDIPVPHEDGSWVSQKVSRIIELIHEYDPNLEVRWIPPAARTRGEAAFAIVELTPQGPRTAFLVQDESDFDERILARIYNADTRVHGNVMPRLADMERAQREYKQKVYQEELAEAHEQAKFLWKTPKHRVQLGKNRFVDL